MAEAKTGLQTGLLRVCAWLTLASLLTGGVSSFALSGQTAAFDGHMMLAAHVAGLLGAALLVGLSLSLPHLRWSPQTLRLLCVTFGGAQLANWFISTLKSFVFVHGIAPGGSTANTIVYVALTITVVIPALIGAALWTFGFKRS